MSNFETRERNWFASLVELDGRTSHLLNKIDQLIEDCAGLSSPYLGGWNPGRVVSAGETPALTHSSSRTDGERITNDNFENSSVTTTT